ncbi:MAG TPA: nicotinamidase [Gemmatimonadota bacterium]|nr:nicotinamidase [Gemmatimonadota bacterium]
MSTTTRRDTPLPGFYDPVHARQWGYRPNEEELFRVANDYAVAHGIRPSGSDRRKVHLLLIDLQKDFCFPEGTLYVGGRSGVGAMEDNDRIARFIYGNLDTISEVTVTLDTHFPFQIFSPSFWVDAEGRPLAAHGTITTDQIRGGAVRPNPAVSSWVSGGSYPWLLRQVEHYCAELEKAGKYVLYLWPPHCLLGSEGHALAGVIQEARLFHAFARHAPALAEVKGGSILTENYSVFAPEVMTRHDGRGSIGQRNSRFLETLLKGDHVIIAGQAASHCVKSSIDDLLDEIMAQDPSLVRKVYVLEDCMSAVAVPNPSDPGDFIADFTPQAEAALQRFRDAGMHVVRSTDPLDQWPELEI